MGVPARQRGFALLLVLWTMVLLALIGSRIAASGRAEAQLAANVRDAAVTEAAADAAVQEAAFHLLDAPPRRWAADGSTRRLQMPSAAVEVRVESEDGKVNPNLASAALLAALLHEVGADTRTAGLVADSILRWRFPWVRPGMNDPTLAAYKAAGLNYGPAGAPFRSLDEVGAVLGMTPDLLNRVRPYLSLYANTTPDPAGASRPVLAALREAFGGGAPSSGGNAPSAVGITAVAAGPNGTRFTRDSASRARAPQRPVRRGSGAGHGLGQAAGRVGRAGQRLAIDARAARPTGAMLTRAPPSWLRSPVLTRMCVCRSPTGVLRLAHTVVL